MDTLVKAWLWRAIDTTEVINYNSTYCSFIVWQSYTVIAATAASVTCGVGCHLSHREADIVFKLAGDVGNC